MRLNLGIAKLDARALESAILAALADHLNASLRSALSAIKAGIAGVIERALVASPEWESLVGGRLQAELGVPRPDTVLRTIITNVAAAAVVELVPVTPSGKSVVGGIRVSLLRADLSEVVGNATQGGTIVSEQGFSVPWLTWLLTGGDEILVLDHEFVAGDFPGSRTGLGVMHRGGTWRVPAEFAGVVSDNWLTRALTAALPDIENLLRTAVQEALS